MRKLPNGISNYETIVRENYIYVDKTMYIEKLENLSDRTIMFLRPRKFGKTLFTSTLECYYDISKKKEFETLFANTYIGENPTKSKNSYQRRCLCNRYNGRVWNFKLRRGFSSY